MKKQLNTLMASAAALLLSAVSCVSVEIQRQVAGDEVGLRPVTSATTKAQPGTFPYTTFGVFANRSSDPAGTDNQAAWGNSDFFKTSVPGNVGGNMTALHISDGCFAQNGTSYAGADPATLQHKPYYWPPEGSLIFAAYAPHISQSKGNIKSTAYRNYASSQEMGYMMIDVTLEPGAEKTFDLLYAQPDHFNGGMTLGTSSTPVPVTFRHAQSKVTFKISNPESQFKVNATLLDCVNSAVYFGGRGWLPNFESPDLLKNYTLFTEQPLSATPAESSIFVIPMQLNGEYPDVKPNTNKIVTLRLEVKNNDNIGSQILEYPMSDYTFTWKPGMHYIYSIAISAGKIEFAEPKIEHMDSIVDL